MEFPPYQEAEPHDLTEGIDKTLGNHLGTIQSFQMPPPEMLFRWMDLVVEKGGVTDELIMLNVVQPPGEVEFSVSRLQAPELKILALDFVRVLALNPATGAS